jgi:3-hydroxybutyryl-CoA dehydratase
MEQSTQKKKIEVGMEMSVEKKITAADVEVFAELSLDRNPIHFDPDFAGRTMFQKPIAHGMLGAALISGALTALMGAGNIWLSLSLKFQKPIYLNDTLICTLRIKEISRRKEVSIDVSVTRGDEIIIAGEVKSMAII